MGVRRAEQRGGQWGRESRVIPVAKKKNDAWLLSRVWDQGPGHGVPGSVGGGAACFEGSGETWKGRTFCFLFFVSFSLRILFYCVRHKMTMFLLKIISKIAKVKIISALMASTSSCPLL